MEKEPPPERTTKSFGVVDAVCEKENERKMWERRAGNDKPSQRDMKKKCARNRETGDDNVVRAGG